MPSLSKLVSAGLLATTTAAFSLVAEPASAQFTCKVQCVNPAGKSTGTLKSSSVQNPQQCEPYIRAQALKCPGQNANGDAAGYASVKIRAGKLAR